MEPTTLPPEDLTHLRRCVDLAREAFDAGDEPFGSILVGLGRIVYAGSTAQLTEWRHSLGLAPGPVLPLPINAVAPGVPTAGPALELADELRELHTLSAARDAAGRRAVSRTTFDVNGY